MENKNLRLIDLTIKEMIFLCSFAKTIRHYGIDGSIYHYGTYAEQKVCITKNNENVWEVYMCERGNILDKATFESCFDACAELFKQSSRTKEERIEMIDYYLKEALKMKKSLRQIDEKEIIPEVNNALLQLKKSKK